MVSRSEPIDPQGAVEALWRLAPEYAQAKAERVYLEEYTRSLRAILMKQWADMPVNAQEREAMADQQYRDHLQGLRAAVEKEETLRWRLVSTQAAVDVWRSMNASNRSVDRATQ